MTPLATFQRVLIFGKVLSLFLFFQKAYAQAHIEALEKGVIIDTVWCLQQPAETYALYLPSYYSKEKKWPVVYIFEPAARGNLPLKHFREGAEKYGYILVASNNAKNGPWDPIFNAADALFLDTFERFEIDTGRVYTSGFSGGSRAALAVAVITKKVQGVIACGAGFPTVPSYKPTSVDKFVYIGLVGNKDMNYSEHHDVQQTLNNLKSKTIYKVWPYVETVVGSVEGEAITFATD